MSSHARRVRGTILLLRGNLREAQEDFDFILGKEPENSRALAFRALTRCQFPSLDAAGLEAANSDVRRALELAPDEPYARLARGIIATWQKDFDSAIVDLTWAVDHNLDPLGAGSYRAVCLIHQREFDRALADLDRAFAKSFVWTKHPIQAARRQCYALKGDFDHTIADFSDLLKVAP